MGKGNGGQNGRTGLIHRRRKAMNAAISRAKKCGTAIYSTLRKNDSNHHLLKRIQSSTDIFGKNLEKMNLS